MSVAAGSITLISKATEVVGDILFSGSLEIEGRVKGNIIAEKGSDAKVRVQDKGFVEGEIRVPSVVINGHINGDVYSNKHVELAAKAVVQGNVHYHMIEMVKGAQVNGSLVYIGAEEAKSPVAAVLPAATASVAGHVGIIGVEKTTAS